MLVRKSLAAALLLLTVAALPLLWLGAHALEHHGHAEEATGSEWPDLARILTHGHEHAEGTPDHEHYLLTSPSLRPDPLRDLQVPAVTSLKAPETERLLPSSTRPWQGGIRLSGSAPPLLDLLCVLLI